MVGVSRRDDGGRRGGPLKIGSPGHQQLRGSAASTDERCQPRTQSSIRDTHVKCALVESGKEELAFPSALARFAIGRARHGRQLGSRMNIRDISSDYTKRQKSICLERLDQFDESDGQWMEVLVEDRTAGPADTAASRIDFAAWLASMPSLRRKIAKFLATGGSRLDTARRFAVSPERISQLRREFLDSWLAFHGEPIAA